MMIGEALAILAALAYGLAGVLIVRGKSTARGDNGVFLSVLLTAVLSWALWTGWGATSVAELFTKDRGRAFATFALAGLFANILGRQWMYRATEQIGAVRAGLFRRLTPLFALPCAFLLLGEQPSLPTLLGGALILVGVLIYMRLPTEMISAFPMSGFMLGALSALAYALAYSFRSLGLELVPDAAIGTCVGAFVGAACLLVITVLNKGLKNGLHYVTVDRRACHWQTALALSTGQLLQFFALKFTTVVSVSVLGTLEVLFSALFVLVVTKSELIVIKRLIIASLLAMIGTGLLFLE